MGRPQTFETDEVVRAARGVFWRDGYESASLPDLEQATGLSRSSIYHAFGSKRGLFDAAVDVAREAAAVAPVGRGLIVPRPSAELRGAVVVEGLADLGFGVHDERPVLRDRFTDRTPLQQQRLDRFRSCDDRDGGV